MLARVIGVLMAFLSAGHALAEPARPAAEPRGVYVGIGVPVLGLGAYEGRRVLALDASPFSVELPAASRLGVRVTVYTVVTIPTPARFGELWFNAELPWYYAGGSRQRTLSGHYVGPVAMFQLHDQDSGGSFAGVGLTLGYRRGLTSSWWFRVGAWGAYHAHVFGPTRADVPTSGLAIGLTLFELGTVFE